MFEILSALNVPNLLSFINVLFSWNAMFIYAAVFIVIVILLIVLLMTKNGRGSDNITAKIEASGITAVNGVSGASEEDSAPIPGESVEGDKKVKKGGNRERFNVLCRIDRNRMAYERVKYDDNVTLKKICDDFRNYCAQKLKLYYSIDDIRRFISGILVSHIVILQGMSGTGKTSLAFAFGKYIDNTTTVIPVQPMWKERTDLIGYYNEFTKRFNETTLLQKMYEANYSKDIYVTLLDELNIARVEYYFAEFLSLLEIPNVEERYLDVVTDTWDNDPKQLKDGRIRLPDNMWFIGTANNDDSTFAISDKVYDRAMIMNLDTKCEKFGGKRVKNLHITAERFKELGKEALEEYGLTVRNEKRLKELDEYMIAKFHVTFGNRIMKQIRTYVPIYEACGGEEAEALDDILAKKIMRKLEMQNPVYVRSVAAEFCDYLDTLFGYDKMKLCKECVHRIEKNA